MSGAWVQKIYECRWKRQVWLVSLWSVNELIGIWQVLFQSGSQNLSIHSSSVKSRVNTEIYCTYTRETLNLVFYMTGRDILRHSWLRNCALQARRSRVRFSMVSLEFFFYLILPAALWYWGRLSLQQKWVPGIFLRSQSGQCVGLTILPLWRADCLEIWEPQPPGTLRACIHIALHFTWRVRFYAIQPAQLVIAHKTNITTTTSLIYILPELTPPRTATSN